MNTISMAGRGSTQRMHSIAKASVTGAALILGVASHANLVMNPGFDDVGTPVNVFITQSGTTATTSSVPH